MTFDWQISHSEIIVKTQGMMYGRQTKRKGGLKKRIQMAKIKRPPANRWCLDFRDVPIVFLDETIKIWPSLIETENSA